MRTAVVTGAASGIGLALALELLDRDWRVAAVTRRPLPEEPRFAIARGTGRLATYHCDLSDATSRRAAVAEIALAETRIDALFNNAGVSTGAMEFSRQGLELHFEVNCVAPYFLAHGLAAGLGAARGTIVNTASDAINFVKRFDPASLEHPGKFKVMTGPYASTKLALALWSSALAPELAARGVTILSVSPGAIDTPLIRGPGLPRWLRPVARLIARPPAVGAGLLLDALAGDAPTGSLLIKGRVKPIPFSACAVATLDTVAKAAEA